MSLRKEHSRSEAYQSLTQARWTGTYHVVCVPKRRRKALFGHMRQALGPIVHALARQKECRIIAGHVMPDHVHMGLEIPPQYAVASVRGSLKGKRAMAMARQCAGRERHCAGEHCWARGSAVSMVGFALEQVRASIREQEDAEGAGRF
jgi:REP-associated tyrosine transposase